MLSIVEASKVTASSKKSLIYYISRTKQLGKYKILMFNPYGAAIGNLTFRMQQAAC